MQLSHKLRIRPSVRLAITLLLVAAWALPTHARLVRVEIERREAVLDGKPFGLAGAYEKIIGRAHYAVRPDNAANTAVVDITLAPTNAAGEIEFAADLYVLQPKDPIKGNGTLLLEISNRGGKAMVSLLNHGERSLDPTEAAHFGDGFLLQQGFTLAWVGWQFDTRDAEDLVRLIAPAASGQTGLVRSDFTLPTKTDFQPIGHVIVGRIGGKEYPVADTNHPSNSLTVRDRPAATRMPIPREHWSFVKEGGRITGIRYPQGFEAGKIYELIYAADDPTLVGLGLVAVRDLASYAKYDPATITPVKHAMVFGISQSGRFLRHFLYQGFNADEQRRKVFDGVMSHVAGAGRGSFNHRFAQPSRDGQPMDAIHYPTDLYPFTDAAYPDPQTQRNEGLLDRTIAAGVMPKFFQTNTSYEYWGRAGSLIHTTPDGKRDAKLPPDVRIYHLAGLQHFPRALPPRHMNVPHIQGRYVMNPNPSAPTLRALVVAMQRWITGQGDPPPSAYPRLDEGTLVPFEQVRDKFPSLADVELPTDVHLAYRMDYGPRWRDQGIISEHPPRVGAAFPVYVPDIDSDGNERGGIRIPQLEAPVATYTPWNLRDPAIGAADQRVSFLGSYFPFEKDEVERESSGDPRPSLDERYKSFADYQAKYTQATLRLVRQGFLLAQDVPGVLKRGRDEWRYARDGIAQPLVRSEYEDLSNVRPDMRFRYGEAALQFGELRLPEGAGPHPVAIVIHGGCWLGSIDLKHIGALSEALTEAGIATWTIEYRRVGNDGGGWPGTFDDIAMGADHLRSLAQEHPLDLERVIVVGHSAGGHFALWLAAREQLAEGSRFRPANPIQLDGVLGLAAAADIAHLHERQVCGHVIDGLMGGAPDEHPERYRVASPMQTVPLQVPQVLINGMRDTFWSSVAGRYIAAAQQAGAELSIIEVPGAGHFELIDPSSAAWPHVRDAALELITKDAAASR